MNPERFDDLHEQASGFYLQGDFRAAAETWRQILIDDPLDDRAQEGVRLCSGLEGGVDPSAQSPPPPTGTISDSLLGSLEELEHEEPSGAAGPVPAGKRSAAEGLLDLTDLADDGLPGSQVDLNDTMMASPADTGDSGIGQTIADSYSAMATDTEQSTNREAPHEFDFSALLDDDEVVEVSSEEVDSEDEFEEEEELAADPDASSMSSSTAELRHRVRELMDTALAAVERGDKDEAMSVLARMQILDEENEAVRSLQEKLRLEIESERGGGSGTPEAADAPVAAEAPPLEILNLGHDEAAPPSAEAEPALAASSTETAPEPAPAASSAETAPEPQQATAQRAGKSEKLRGLTSSLPAVPPPVLWAAAAGVLLLGLAFMSWHFLGGADTPELARGAAKPAETKPAPKPTQVAPEQPAAAAAAAAEPEPAGTEPLVPDDRPVEVAVSEILAQADNLFEAEDYRAAVVAYDEVLALAPDHVRARERLLVAGNRYRDIRAEEQEWTNAVRAFEMGEYQQALRAFYRVAEDKRPKNLDRYKVSGWYNLGIVALKAGNCRDAVTHLYEAQGISPNDAGTVTALELARLCRRGERDTPSYQLAVGMLEVRGLDD